MKHFLFFFCFSVFAFEDNSAGEQGRVQIGSNTQYISEGDEIEFEVTFIGHPDTDPNRPPDATLKFTFTDKKGNKSPEYLASKWPSNCFHVRFLGGPDLSGRWWSSSHPNWERKFGRWLLTTKVIVMAKNDNCTSATVDEVPSFNSPNKLIMKTALVSQLTDGTFDIAPVSIKNILMIGDTDHGSPDASGQEGRAQTHVSEALDHWIFEEPAHTNRDAANIVTDADTVTNTDEEEEQVFLATNELLQDVRLVVYFDAERNCFVREMYAEDRECTQEELDVASTVLNAWDALDAKEVVKLKNSGKLPNVSVRSKPMYDNILVDFICGDVLSRHSCESLSSVYFVSSSIGVGLLVIPVTAPIGGVILGVTNFIAFTGWAPVRLFPPCPRDWEEWEYWEDWRVGSHCKYLLKTNYTRGWYSREMRRRRNNK
ncbi:MAG: hypothetical protein OXH36_01610 [Bdellovibrionales bacterium]|nr:hypothetical protein [Bdellovibrionales bacterium]